MIQDLMQALTRSLLFVPMLLFLAVLWKFDPRLGATRALRPQSRMGPILTFLMGFWFLWGTFAEAERAFHLPL